MPFCNPKSPIYRINLSKSHVIALFLKNKENVQRESKSLVYLNSRLPFAEYVHSGVWIVVTSEVLKLPLFAKIGPACRVKLLCIHPLV